VKSAPTPEERAQLASAGMAWGMGCSVVASILISVIGGLLIDQATDRTPLFTLIGVGLGLLLAGYQLWELAQLSSKAGKVGPVARRVARAQSLAASRKTKQH
jgi:F0F1-type ATP synthase assembly protein I